MTPERTHPNEETAGRRHPPGLLRRAARAAGQVRTARGTRLAYRWAVAVVGGVITIGGLILVPLPGPGWVIVFVGLALLAREFAWAKRLLHFGRSRLASWTAWLRRQRLWVRLAVTLSAAALAGSLLLLLALLLGIPPLARSWLAPVLPWL